MRKTTNKKIFFVLLLILLNFCLSYGEVKQILSFPKRKINVNGRNLYVLIADNQKRREQGLSNITKEEFKRLGIDGMLFIFDDEREKTFQAWYMQFDLMLLSLGKKRDNTYFIKERKPLRIGSIEKVKGKYILEVPLQNTLTGKQE